MKKQIITRTRYKVYGIRYMAFLYFLIPLYLYTSFPLSAQNIGINTTGATPNAKALLDIDAGANNLGMLIPRLTTTQRDLIASPLPHSLLIFNTTTDCYEGYNANTSSWVAFGCIDCTVPTAVSASAAPNPICEGSTLNLTGGATNATGWSWTGPNSYTSSSQSPTITNITAAG